jgi:flagellar basal-body rod protein FlgG
LYVAAAGMAAEQVRQDMIANDLANTQTAGYKPDRAVQADFSEVLLSSRQDGSAVGPVGQGPAITDRYTDLDPDPIHDSDHPLDMAIQGEGYFAVRTQQGIRYTRDGEFSAAADGTLVDAQGDPVLSPTDGTIRVGAGGIVDPGAVGVFALDDPVKAGDDLFTGRLDPARPAARGVVRTGALEASGVDAAKAMVDMITSLRAYESGQKVIQTIDTTLGKAAGTVGSIR